MEAKRMTEFTMGKVSDIPPAPPRGSTRGGLPQALRNLDKDDALFIPAKDGESLHKIQTRASASVRSAGPPGTFTTRIDRERNGVWVFLRQNSTA